MDQTSEIRKLSCYAVLSTGLSGETYLLSHMRLVLLLVYKKKYRLINVNRVIEDFYGEFHYKIEYFPMLKILSLATERGYLKKNHNSKKYEYTDKIDEFRSVENEIKKYENEQKRLVQHFVDYCLKEGVTYTSEEAESIVISYINSQKIEHISGHIKTEQEDKKLDYLVGRFIYELKDNNPSLFSFINNMVIGAILADCLVFHEVIENGKQLDGLSIVLDTTPMFIALGIDEAERGEYYKALLNSIKNKGAQVAMFEHSYHEMQQILQGAADWVNSVNYDPSKASATTAYFRSIHANREDVELFSISLRKKIEELGVEIISAQYDPKEYNCQIDESKLTDMIVDYYSKTNESFDKDSQMRSINLDVKSITSIYYLRKKEEPILIQDANYLFVTANRSLAKVASDYHRKYEQTGGNSLPSTLTDVFLGTYLWLSDPMQITKMNERQIISQAYLAVQPNEALLEKLVNSIEKLCEYDVISSDVCYAMRSSKLVSEKLAQKTLGDPEAFTDATPLEILQSIKDEGARQGREEMQLLLDRQIEKAQEEKNELEKRHSQEKDEYKEIIKEYKKKELREKMKELAVLEQKIEKGARSQKRCRNILIGLLCILLFAFIFSLIYLFVWKDNPISPIIGYLCAVVPGFCFVLSLIGSLKSSNGINIKKWIQQIPKWAEDRKLKRLHFSFDKYNEVKNTITKLKEELHE